MSCLTVFLSPINLLFFIIIAGFAVGKIRIRRISLGIAGILFVAILAGFLINRLMPEEYVEILTDTQSTMKIFSKLGTSLFVSVIGLQTGSSVKNDSKESLMAFMIGSVMSISGMMLIQLLSALDKAISYPTLLGVLCGALTSTPGLSSVCELIGTGSEEAVWGYGCSYLPGVIFAVFFAQLFSRNTSGNGSGQAQNTVVAGKIYPELMLIGITALLGNILGSIHIPILRISVGNTASTLLVGLIVGGIVRRKRAVTQISPQILNAFRNTGLALFFTGTGFATGIRSVSFDIKSVLYGAIITLTAIFCGILLCRVVSSRHRLQGGFVIAGGMTSSPAYGAISSKANDASVGHFSFAYFGSLISLITALQIAGR